MPLPVELSIIFRNKQKSYKMVLILAMIEEYAETHKREFSFNRVTDHFLDYFINSQTEGKKVDSCPNGMATSWGGISVSQTKSLLKTPIDALSSVIEINYENQTIGFKPDVWIKLDETSINELKNYALIELDNYNNQLYSAPSLNEYLTSILNGYIQAKTQLFTNHPLGTLFRQTIPGQLKKLPFIDEDYKIQGSIGQGNWATIPWIAIMDRRITESTQHGEYIVYLFAEDMSSVYLTLAQGVTVPTNQGKREGYRYLQQKVQEMRELLPLEGTHKDENIHLTSSGIGRDYQVSTVAYVRYDKDHLPDDEQLLIDLENFINNYKHYVQRVIEPVDHSTPTFKYTMAHLYLGQGILSFLGRNSSPVSLEELESNFTSVLISGEEVKHPKERIQHVGRAIQELGLLNIQDRKYDLTTQGLKYAQAFDENIWKLSSPQINIIRDQISKADHTTTNLVKVMKLAISITRQLNIFSLGQFNSMFISQMGLTEDWGAVTQENRSRFMLNWLEELRYVKKYGNEYNFIEDEVKEPLNSKSVLERIHQIRSYIYQRGFHYPNNLIENFYLSLKTKPFVILAGVSGTGKTKLVKLFAEAMGATSHNNQFTLIPVRPDWSDPSDLLGYKDLTGIFRPGRLTEVLVEALRPGNRHKPYFICLDEMNLARVEHYFSDLLSIIETQEWQNDEIITSFLIHKEFLRLEDQPIYGNLFLPDNVYLIGTVNMDETTHPFSKKVLDRANTIEFNYINLDQYPDQTLEINQNISQASNSFLRNEYLQLSDAFGDFSDLIKTTTQRLVKINNILEEIHSHVGFRIRDAICFYMVYNYRFQLMGENDAFDLQLLQKILPRIQGSSSSVKRVLLQLMQEAIGKTLNIDAFREDASELYLKWASNETSEIANYPQSARKIAFMLRRLEEDGFTSYWLS